MGKHLLDTSRPRLRTLPKALPIEEFGFNSLAVEAAEWHGKVLTLVLSASDLAAARPGQVPQDVGTKPSQVVIVQSRSGVGTNAAELVDCGAPMHESGGRGIGGLSL
jgi:hypothetical protein